MSAKSILKVIYSPDKAFREIIQKPKYIGPILIMILFILANMGFAYTLISRRYFEQTLPTAKQLDEWTENSALWTHVSGATARDNYTDFINGTYYGNRSIEFSIVDSKQIWMQLSDIGTVNCLGSEGYQNLSFRIKWTSPAAKPQNVTIYLFSSTASDYFYYNLTQNFSTFDSAVWNNLTIPLGSQTWLSSSATASWGTITGLKLEFAWPETSNITLLVDGLFFRGIFQSQMGDIAVYLLSFSLTAFMQYIIQWVLIGGLIYIMTKAFRANIVWKPLLILVGFALITLFIQSIINVAAVSTMPTLYYPLEYIGGVNGEGTDAYNKLVAQTGLVSLTSNIVQIAVYIWTSVLCAIAIRSLTERSWTMSFLVGALAYFFSILALGFLLGI